MGEACQLGSNYGQTVSAGLFGEYIPASWYALKVRKGSEEAVVSALELRGLDPYCPIHKERRRYSDRMKVVSKPLFPGYVFCSFAIEKKLPVVSCPGVEYIVGCAGVATVIPDVQIDSIRRMVDAGAVAEERFVPGEKVRVTHGALAGVEGVVVRESRGTRLFVSIEMLNRSASLWIDQAHIVLAA